MYSTKYEDIRIYVHFAVGSSVEHIFKSGVGVTWYLK